MDDAKICETIRAILKRGNDVMIKRAGDGIVVMEIRKEIWYKTE